jgi:adenosyl cobinamide kinase/adenosyl cobinamide phosphate guanylyltransferase
VITLVLGGARSGKSAIAETRAEQFGDAVTYIATAEVSDDEFAARVATHRDRRPPEWTTVESHDLPATLRDISAGPVLVDSLGTWIARQPDFAVDIDALVKALAARTGPTVIVSEEAGLGVHPETAAGRRWRDVLGDVNQAVAAVADSVLLVIAGRVVEL